MKKTAIATALLLASGAVNAATIDSLNITFGDFGMNAAPVADGVNEFSGAVAAGTTGDTYHIVDAFNFNNLFGMVDIMTIGSGFSGNDDGGVVTMDFSNFAVDYNGTVIPQGPNAGSLTFSGDANTQTFSASWNSLIVGGPFDGNTGYWYIEGSYTTATSEVPVPAAVWLFGSGLIGLAGIARRRKAA